jgi:hypothetical protein
MFTTEKLVEQQQPEQKPIIIPQEPKKPPPTMWVDFLVCRYLCSFVYINCRKKAYVYRRGFYGTSDWSLWVIFQPDLLCTVTTEKSSRRDSDVGSNRIVLYRLSTDDEEEMLYGDTDSSDLFFTNTPTEFQPPQR